MSFERIFELVDRWRARRTEARLREELEVHAECRSAELLAKGMTAAQARRAVDRRIGDVDRTVREGIAVMHEPHGLMRRILTGCDHDIGSAHRGLARRAGFTLTSVATIAIAVAASAALWSVAHAVVFRALPFEEPERLVRLGERHADMPESVVASYRSYATWRDRARSFSGIAATRPQEFNLETADDPVRVSGARVTFNYFDVMAAAPSIGRVFTRQEDAPGGAPVVIIGEGLWKRAFGGDPGVLGRDVRIDGVSRTIVGVVPARESLPSLGWSDLFIPLGLDEAEALTSDNRWLLITGRLNRVSSIDRARAEVDALQDDLRRAWPDTHEAWTSTTRDLQEWVVGRSRPIAHVLLAAGALVVGTCAFSLATLMLVQFTGRRRELAVRLALGAAHFRLIRLALVEGVLLGAVGAMVGLSLTHILLTGLASLGPVLQVPRIAAAGLSMATAAVAMAAAVVITVGLQVLALLGASAVGHGTAIGSRSREGTVPRAVALVQRGLAVAQLAVALFAIVAAVSLARSFERVQRIDPGFTTDSVLSLQVALPSSRYPDGQDRVAFAKRLLARLHELPGAASTGVVQHLPLGLSRGRVGIRVPGLDRAPGQEPIVQYNVVGGQYFESLRIALVEGRDFTDAEAWDGTSSVVVVNHALARRFIQGPPVGQALWLSDKSEPLRIVGVVADVRRETLEHPPEPELFLPFALAPPSTLSFAVQVAGEPDHVTASVRTAVRAEDPLLPVASLMTQQQIMARAVAPRRVQTLAVVALASVTIGLAVLGVFGLVTRSVAARGREFGIRLAVGARVGDILTMVLRETAALLAGAVAIGLGMLFATGRFLSAVLYETDPLDPGTLAAAAAVLTLLVLVATLWPAHRAARTDSAAILRQEG